MRRTNVKCAEHGNLHDHENQKCRTADQILTLGLTYILTRLPFKQGCGVGVGVGRNFRWSRIRKEFLGGVGASKNVLTPTPTSV
jgi:hypothetical protein